MKHKSVYVLEGYSAIFEPYGDAWLKDLRNWSYEGGGGGGGGKGDIIGWSGLFFLYDRGWVIIKI